MKKVILEKETVYEKAQYEGKWDIKYGEEGTSFPFYFYEDVNNAIISFLFPHNILYEVSRNVLKRFYDENPQIRITKFNKDRLLIPLSICTKVNVS